jgi:hypothetical protein
MYVDYVMRERYPTCSKRDIQGKPTSDDNEWIWGARRECPATTQQTKPMEDMIMTKQDIQTQRTMTAPEATARTEAIVKPARAPMPGKMAIAPLEPPVDEGLAQVALAPVCLAPAPLVEPVAAAPPEAEPEPAAPVAAAAIWVLPLPTEVTVLQLDDEGVL